MRWRGRRTLRYCQRLSAVGGGGGGGAVITAYEYTLQLHIIIIIITESKEDKSLEISIGPASRADLGIKNSNRR